MKPYKRGTMVSDGSDTIKLPNIGTIGWAIDQMKAGESVTRRTWNGRNQFLRLQLPDENSKMTLPYVYLRTVQGKFVPWLCSQIDLLAEDWEIFFDGQ